MRRYVLLAITFMLLLSCGGERKVNEAPPTKAAKAAKSTRVIIHITGLSTFTDAEVDPQDGKAVPMTLSLINAGEGHERHLPILLVGNQYVGSSLQDRALVTKGDFRYLTLIGEELLFPGLETNELKYSREPVSCANTKSTSMAWVPRIGMIANDLPGGPLKHEHLDGRYLYRTPNKKRIAAYTEVAHGTLEANLLSPVVWQFKSGRGASDATHEQAIAQEVLWKFTIPEEHLIIHSRVFDPAGAIQRPLLRLNAQEGKIEFTIANIAESDIGVLTGNTPGGLAEEVDQHFASYYDFLSDKTAKKRIPVAWGVCKNNQLSNDPCDIAQFVAFKNPPTCNGQTANGTAGGLNCGPDGQP